MPTNSSTVNTYSIDINKLDNNFQKFFNQVNKSADKGEKSFNKFGNSGKRAVTGLVSGFQQLANNRFIQALVGGWGIASLITEAHQFNVEVADWAAGMRDVSDEFGNTSKAMQLSNAVFGASAVNFNKSMEIVKTLGGKGLPLATEGFADLAINISNVEHASGISADALADISVNAIKYWKVSVDGSKQMISSVMGAQKAFGLTNGQMQEIMQTVNKTQGSMGALFLDGEKSSIALAKGITMATGALVKMGVQAQVANQFVDGLMDVENVSQNAALLRQMGITYQEQIDMMENADGKEVFFNKLMTNLPELSRRIQSIRNPMARLEFSKSLGLPLEIASKMARATGSEIEQLMEDYKKSSIEKDALQKKQQQMAADTQKFNDALHFMKMNVFLPMMGFVNSSYGLFMKVMSGLSNKLQFIMKYIAKAFDVVKISLTPFFDWIAGGSTFKGFVNSLVKSAVNFVDALIWYVPKIINVIVGALPIVAEGLKKVIEKITPIIEKKLPPLIEAIKNGLKTILPAVGNFLWTLLKTVLKELPGFISTIFSASPLVGALLTGGIMLKGFVAFHKSITAFKSAIDMISPNILQSIGKIGTSVSNSMGGAVSKTLSPALSKLGPLLSNPYTIAAAAAAAVVAGGVLGYRQADRNYKDVNKGQSADSNQKLASAVNWQGALLQAGIGLVSEKKAAQFGKFRATAETGFTQGLSDVGPTGLFKALSNFDFNNVTSSIGRLGGAIFGLTPGIGQIVALATKFNDMFGRKNLVGEEAERYQELNNLKREMNQEEFNEWQKLSDKRSNLQAGYITKIINFGKQIPEMVKNYAIDIYNTIISIPQKVSSFVSGIFDGISGLWESVKTNISGFGNVIAEQWGKLKEYVAVKIKEIAGAFNNLSFSSILLSLKNTFNSVIDDIQSYMGGMLFKLMRYISTTPIGQLIFEGASLVTDGLSDWLAQREIDEKLMNQATNSMLLAKGSDANINKAIESLQLLLGQGGGAEAQASIQNKILKLQEMLTARRNEDYANAEEQRKLSMQSNNLLGGIAGATAQTAENTAVKPEGNRIDYLKAVLGGQGLLDTKFMV